jgi:hypothetical protein
MWSWFKAASSFVWLALRQFFPFSSAGCALRGAICGYATCAFAVWAEFLELPGNRFFRNVLHHWEVYPGLRLGIDFSFEI